MRKVKRILDGCGFFFCFICFICCSCCGCYGCCGCLFLDWC